MRRVRRVNEAHAFAAKIDYLTIDENARRPIGEVIERHHAAGLSMRRLRVGRSGEPFVHRAALVRFEVAICDPAQLFGRDDAAQRVAVKRKHLAQTSVKHHWLIAEHQELVEDEAGGQGDVWHVGREAINAIGDFVDFGFPGGLP